MNNFQEPFLYCEVICISSMSTVGNKPAFIRVSTIDFFVEMKGKLNDKKKIQYFFG